MRKAFLYALACLASLNGALLFIEVSQFAFLLPIAVFFNWPGILLLGVDETTEAYGYTGERILFFVLSLPVLAFYAYVLARITAASQTRTTRRS